MVGNKGKSKTGRTIIAAVLTGILIFAALILYQNRDKLFSPGGSGLAGLDEPYSYEYGANQQFALMGEQLAISSSTGLQLLDKKGYPLIRQVFAMKNPAVSANGKFCVFYDIGGTALRMFSGGEILELDTEGQIISVSMNGGGSLAVACDETSSRGTVTVYDDAGKPVYKWYSGSGYVLDASLSPDSHRLAVLCLEPSGSVIHLFSLDSEDETASVLIPRDLAFKVSFMENDSFCVLSESAVRFYSAEGEELAAHPFGEKSMTGFLLSEDVCVISISRYVTGSDTALTGFSPKGGVLGEAELDYYPLSISAAGDTLMLLGSDKAVTLSRDMTVISETEIPSGYSNAVLLPDGGCLLLSSYYGERIALK